MASALASVLTDDQREILTESVLDGNTLMLPDGLERSRYMSIMKVIESMGGKWDRKAKTHVFPEGRIQKIEEILSSGKVPAKNPDAFFRTPPLVLEELMKHSGLKPASSYTEDFRILEPSAGDGAIVKAVLHVLGGISNSKVAIDAVEINDERFKLLANSLFRIVDSYNDDFLRFFLITDSRYDLIIMNPPFSVAGDPQYYHRHVMAAWDLLKPGGRLVSVVPSNYMERSGKKSEEFNSIAEHAAAFAFYPLPEDSFKESGTSVRCAIIGLDKHR